MATKKKQDPVGESKTQLDALLTSFGRLLYENIQAGGIAYYFDPPDPALALQARRLVRDVVAEKLSDRKKKVVPEKVTLRAASVQTPGKPVAKAPVKKTPPLPPKTKTVAKPVVAKLTGKPPVKAPKNQMVAVLKGVTNVLMSEFKAAVAPSLPSAEPVEPQAVAPVLEVSEQPEAAVALPEKSESGWSAPGTSRRGQLEPYTKLNVALHVAENKVLDVQRDLADCLAAGLLHTTGDRTAAYQAKLDEKIQKIIVLMRKKREEIKRIMDRKKRFFADNPDVETWKVEEAFLLQIEQEITQTTRRVDGLIDEVVVLFKNINEVFEKDLEQARADRQNEQIRDAWIASAEPQEQEEVSAEPEPAASASGEYPAEENVQEPASAAEEESSVEESEEELPAEEQAVQEEILEAEDADTDEDTGDYGLLETAARKLRSESASDDDKIAVLHAVFRNAPKRAVPFLYELAREVDIFSQRKLLSFLNLLDYPTMVDLYRRFINDESSALRLQGVMGLVKLKTEEAKHVLVSAIRDRDAHVRRFIVNHLNHTAGEPEATAIARLSADTDEGVARIAIRKLGIMGNHFAFVTIVPKLESQNIKICKEAIDALFSMVGTDLGYNYSAPYPERKRQARAWNTLAKQSYTKPRLLRELREQYISGGKPARSRDEADSASSAKGSKDKDSAYRRAKRF
ncbi:MAG: hypothetical protein HQL18_02905 [Candidatus Omnitrophica bacterium]|nr:hypothetical protein [Candidatus Omnitrophota bacterium]